MRSLTRHTDMRASALVIGFVAERPNTDRVARQRRERSGVTPAHVVVSLIFTLGLLAMPCSANATAGAVSFDELPTVSSGEYPSSVVLADLNNDARADVVTGTPESCCGSIFINQGAGQLAANAAPFTGNGPYLPAVGDLDTDGYVDLVVPNQYGNNISILLGNGNGSFGTESQLSSPQFSLGSAIADFDQDGHPDIAVTAWTPYGIGVRLGNGDGTFSQPSYFLVGNEPTALAVGDLNHDLALDLVAFNDNLDDISVLLGDGAGSFASAVSVPTGSHAGAAASAIAIADFNGDTHPDIAVPNSGGGSAGIMLGLGDGSFAPVYQVPAGYRPVSVAAADLNADGNNDLVVGSQDGVYVFVGDGSGGFAGQPGLALDGGPLAIADLNGDARPDIVGGDNVLQGVKVFLNTGPDEGIPSNVVSSPVAPGQSVSTNSVASPGDPTGTIITTPVAGQVSVSEEPATGTSPAGYAFAAQQVTIQAPSASVSDPLRLVFLLDASVLPAGTDADSLVVFRNGVAIDACANGSGQAAPDPCVAQRDALSGGDVELTVLTSEASRWNFGARVAAGGPRITIATPDGDARYVLKAEVRASYSCTPGSGGSKIKSCKGTVSNGSKIDTKQLGTHTFTVLARDEADKTTTKSVRYRVMADTKAPKASLELPKDGAKYKLKSVVRASYSCTDESGGSGLASCKGTVSNGSRIDTGKLGSRTFTVVAEDEAANTTTKTNRYTVVK